MKRSFAVFLLLLIFVVTLSLRLYIGFQSDKFSYDSYFSLRQVEKISDEGVPFFNDDLSYGGRTHLFPPVFYYLVSPFVFLGVNIIAKLIPNIFFSLIIIPVYLITFYITKRRVVALISAFFSAFMPITFSFVNDFSEYSFVLFIVLFLFYFFLKSDSKFHLYSFIIFLIILIFTHSSSLILIFSLLVYLLLLKASSVLINERESELILFSSLLVLWFNFILYKKAFLAHGMDVVWQNIPLQILTNYFFELNIIQVIYQIGFLPVVLGVYAVYHVLFKERRSSLILFAGLFLSVLILLWLKLVPFKLGLLFLSLALIILSSYSLKLIFLYFEKTKFKYASKIYLSLMVLFFVLSAVIPSIGLGFSSINVLPSDYEINALKWLAENSLPDSVVVGRVDEGHLINYFAQRKNVIDNKFLLVNDAQQRYDDVRAIYSLRLKTEALRRLNKYDVTYLYISNRSGFEEESYLYYLEPDCFKMIYNDSALIYEVTCTID